MPDRRKPISFDTTLRNPYRIPDFIKIFKQYEGQVLSNELILQIEAELIKEKKYEPTRRTLGTYRRTFNGRHVRNFVAEDQSEGAEQRVISLFEEWENNDAGYMELSDIVYLLKNTVTDHDHHGLKGWRSRLWTQCSFLNELGLVYMEKERVIRVSEVGNYMLTNYDEDADNSSYIESAFLSSFAKYQTNNPFRSNTISVNFVPLVLNVIKYLKDHYNRPGIFYQDLTFVIAWDNNNYAQLAEYIQAFRNEFHYNNVSNELVYSYAMNLLDETTPNDVIAEATPEFLEAKRNDYKFSKLTRETRDEVIRKLRMTRLVAFRGAGRFLDFNSLEMDKINHIMGNLSNNIPEFLNDDEYFNYMGALDQSLLFADEEESEEELSAKERAIQNFATNKSWEYLRTQIACLVNGSESRDEMLRFIGAPVRLEFLSAVILKKALPGLQVKANYLADDEGIPYRTAGGQHGESVGADIDVYENDVHAIVEPTVAPSRSFQVEHEVPSITNHVFGSKRKDVDENAGFNEWFAIFIAPRLVRDVADQVAAKRLINHVEIYPWNADDFLEFSASNTEINSIKDYKIIRDYMQPQIL